MGDDLKWEENGGRRAVLIAGPTASGKSRRALEIARQSGGIIVNTDSMQVYAQLAIITARPSPADEAAAPHRLYGHVPVTERYSTGRWLADVAEVVADTSSETLIFVGGTGLYFDALTNGFAEIPPVPDAVVRSVEDRLTGLDEPQRMALLTAADPEAAQRLGTADPQRVARALAVHEATGRPLSAFLGKTLPSPIAGFRLERMVIDPGREVTNERVAQRFATMMETGAVAEVEALLAQNLDPALPATKAIGVPEIAAMLGGEISRAEAIERASIATRQYAKRQRTWFRNRMGDWPRAAG
jgi:tRNA dimethylallyltransferase